MAKETVTSKKQYGTVDMAAVKDAWDAYNSKKGRFSPKEGSYNIRILPPAKRGLYYVKYGMHYNANLVAKGAPSDKLSIACLRLTLNQDCPLCRAVDALYAEARMSEREDSTLLKIAGKVRARERYAVNIVDMDDKKAGVLIWDFPPTGYKLVQSIFNRWGNVTDPDGPEGQVLEVTYTTKDKFTSVSNVQPTGDRSPIPVEDWFDKLNDLDKFVQQSVVPGAEMKSWFKGDETTEKEEEHDNEEEEHDEAGDEASGHEEEKEEGDNEDASDEGSNEKGFNEEEALNDPEVQRLLAEVEKRRKKK